MSTDPRGDAQRRKAERLIPAFQTWASDRLHLNLTPTNREDVTLLLAMAMRSLVGIPETRTDAEDHDLLPVMWHEIADLAGLPAARHPSCTTIEKVIVRLTNRANDLALVTDTDLFDMAAGAA